MDNIQAVNNSVSNIRLKKRMNAMYMDAFSFDKVSHAAIDL